jgi:hypothetical protein
VDVPENERKYEVVTQCYVPVGSGLRYKKPGQVVTLDDDAAAELAEFLTPVQEGVAERNTPEADTPDDDEPDDDEPDDDEEEVDSDAGEPAPADE